MNSISISRVSLDGRHVSVLGHELEDARLASALRSLGVQAKLYSGKPEGRVVDLVRQLLRMRSDVYAFWVSPQSAGPTIQLARGLRGLRPDLKFFFWGPECDPAHEAQIARLAFRGRSLDAEQALAEMSPWLASPTSPVDPLQFSPYLSGLASQEEVFRLGISASQPRAALDQELAWCRSVPARKGAPIRLLAERMETGSVIEACESMGDLARAHELLLRISAMQATDALLEMARRHGIGVERVADADAEFTRSVDICGNGLTALHAGIYFDGNSSPATYHLGMSLDLTLEERRQAYDWAAPNMSLRSAAVVSSSRQIVSRLLPSFETKGDGETLGWPKHVYSLGRDDNSATSEISFDGRGTTRSVAELPLSRLDELDELKADRVFITLRETADVDALERKLKRFHDEGRLRVNPATRLVMFENSCRWLGSGACGLPLLRRLHVESDQQVSACRDSGSIGKLGDSFEQLVLNVRQTQQLEDVRRGCATCPVRDQCSRCTQLPSSWGGRYCEIRQGYAQTSLFFEMMGFAHFAKSMLPGGLPDTELAVSGPGLPALHYGGPAGAPRMGKRPLLIESGDQLLAWWRGGRRLMRLSAPMAMMLEAWWLGADAEDVQSELSRVFHVDLETARTSLDQGMTRLREGGLVDG